MGIATRLATAINSLRDRNRFAKNGNTLSSELNRLYAQHHADCRKKSIIQSNADDLTTAALLAKDGMVKLPPLEPNAISEISERVKQHFASIPSENGFAYAKLDFAQTLAPFVYEAMRARVAGVLEAYYRSHFQPYWSRILHYESGYVHPPSSSFGYHIDDNPKQLLKVFFYLNDTRESNAAFRAFDYSASRKLLKKGFISSSEALREKSQALVTDAFVKENLRILEGDAGTILIVDNNLVHKATVPQEGYRDALVVEVYPAERPFTEESIRRALGAEIKTDYPLDPYHNDLQDS